jgi:hypothetical protein
VIVGFNEQEIRSILGIEVACVHNSFFVLNWAASEDIQKT